ncbi:MAG TPA: winged helix DNA-binding domain-containing protein [Candidatus Limnocylindria bacterium]|nr:winged helix DNA-binding domain-containing protein [Candidatus Limnocylindria bacterium]
MQTNELGRLRLLNQRLTGAPLGSAEGVVGWLGAVQAQEYAYAKWSVGQRTEGVQHTDLDRLLADGSIIRTHILRPTWHFVRAEDLRWMMELSGPRVEARNRHRYRQLEMNELTLGRARDLIRAGLSGGRRLTRPQIGELLTAGGVDVTQPQRREHIVMHAELNLLICSGGLDGRNQTYTLVDEVVPPAAPLDEDEALGQLTRRYFASHGPSTIPDFAWWSGMKVSEIKRGLTAAGSELKSFEIEGTTYWAADEPQPALQPRRAHLLQAFDELVVGYQRTRTVPLDPNSMSHPIVIDGEIVGRWRRVVARSGAGVDARLWAPLDGAQNEALEAEIARCEAFYAD